MRERQGEEKMQKRENAVIINSEGREGGEKGEIDTSEQEDKRKKGRVNERKEGEEKEMECEGGSECEKREGKKGKGVMEKPIAKMVASID